MFLFEQPSLPIAVLSSGTAICVQGVQAQTVANFLLAFEAGLSVIPVVNKVR